MVLDEPHGQLRLDLRQPEARREPPRQGGAGQRMVLLPALGDVVQEHREVERVAARHRRHQLVGERVGVARPAGVDLGQDADRAQQVLVHRVVVVHVELHQRHDAAELGDEPPEHPRLVHAAQRRLGRAPRRQDVHEQPVGFRAFPQAPVDAAQRQRDEARGVRMDRQVIEVRDREQADEIDGIALEDVAARHRDAVELDAEVARAGDGAGAALEALHDAVERWGRRRFPLLDGGAHDGGEVADVLRDQEIVLHEPLDAAEARPGAVAEPGRDAALVVEAQTLLGAARHDVELAAHPPQELLAAAEQAELLGGEQAGPHKRCRVGHPVGIFGDPEQRVEIAQAALALLDVGLDEVARRSGAADAGLALGHLGGDELARRPGLDFAVEAGLEVVEEGGVAQDEAGFEQRRADRHVRLGLPHAFVDRAGRVADLLAQVPQHVEDGLDHALAPGRLLVGEQEEEVDVGPGRQRGAAVAADRRDAEPLRR